MEKILHILKDYADVFYAGSLVMVNIGTKSSFGNRSKFCFNNSTHLLYNSNQVTVDTGKSNSGRNGLDEVDSKISVKEHLNQLTDAHKDFGLSQGSVESPFEQGISPNNVPYYIKVEGFFFDGYIMVA
ncbi:hypothetical protein CRENBAI_005388 [Crenichthys baileyi]|uniref:Uncharacterized protein n=1 Tax=Crenichthys baileyi TaxID=28760 RepID=A0AAV9RSC8_9TELE